MPSRRTWTGTAESMRPVEEFPNEDRVWIRGVLADLDDMLATDDRLTADAYAAINQFAWREVAVMPIGVLGVVLISEFVSAKVRERIT